MHKMKMTGTILCFRDDRKTAQVNMHVHVLWLEEIILEVSAGTVLSLSFPDFFFQLID